jgi:hypothetical protein
VENEEYNLKLPEHYAINLIARVDSGFYKEAIMKSAESKLQKSFKKVFEFISRNTEDNNIKRANKRRVTILSKGLKDLQHVLWRSEISRAVNDSGTIAWRNCIARWQDFYKQRARLGKTLNRRSRQYRGQISEPLKDRHRMVSEVQKRYYRKVCISASIHVGNRYILNANTRYKQVAGGGKVKIEDLGYESRKFGGRVKGWWEFQEQGNQLVAPRNFLLQGDGSVHKEDMEPFVKNVTKAVNSAWAKEIKKIRTKLNKVK